MPSLSQVFTSIANAIRTKSETSILYSPIDMPQAILDIETGIDTSDATAVAGDILATKTAYAVGEKVTGNMTNNGAVSASLNTSTTSYTVPAGYHNGSGTVSITTQTKSATPSTTEQTISPDSGKVLSSVSVSAISTQTKSTTPTTRSATAATVTPDSGKYLTSVTVNTTSVPNTNSGTKTITSSDTNWISGNVDMGATNTYRYVNAVNVYNKGKADGLSAADYLEFNFTAEWKTVTLKKACTKMGFIVGHSNGPGAGSQTGIKYNGTLLTNYTKIYGSGSDTLYVYETSGSFASGASVSFKGLTAKYGAILYY